MTAVTIWRLVVFVVSFCSFLILINRFRVNRQNWNVKTRDYWYALTAWSFTGAMGSLEGVLRHTPPRYSIVLTTTAAVVTLIGVLRKGDWGDKDRPKR